MKRSLTDLLVQGNKLLPKTGQVDVFDKGYPGLALRLSYGGAKTWVLAYRGYSPTANKVTARRVKLGDYPAMTLAGARDAWRVARAAVQSGRDPTKKAPDDTVQGAVDTWLATEQAELRRRGEIERIFRKDVLPFWATRKISDITPHDCMNVIDAVAKRGRVMGNRTHAHLRSFFGWCQSRHMIAANPMAGLRRPLKKEKSRDRVLDDKELAAVWRASESLGWPFGHALQLAILTGCRREEISALTWSEIVDGEIRLSGQRTKNGSPHVIPLSTAARKLVASFPRVVGTDYVFPSQTKRRCHISDWDTNMKQLRATLTIPHFRLHDIRRSAATGLQKLGAPLQVTEAILNHTGSRGGVAGIYQCYDYAQEKAAWLEKWGHHVTSGLKPGNDKRGRAAA